MNVQIIKFVFVTAFSLINGLEIKIPLDHDYQNKGAYTLGFLNILHLCSGLQPKNPDHHGGVFNFSNFSRSKKI